MKGRKREWKKERMKEREDCIRHSTCNKKNSLALFLILSVLKRRCRRHERLFPILSFHKEREESEAKRYTRKCSGFDRRKKESKLQLNLRSVQLKGMFWGKKEKRGRKKRGYQSDRKEISFWGKNEARERGTEERMRRKKNIRSKRVELTELSFMYLCCKQFSPYFSSIEKWKKEFLSENGKVTKKSETETE